MRDSPFYFNKSKVKGDVYMQICHRDVGFLASLGSAEGAWKKLVYEGKAKPEAIAKLTNLDKKTTNFEKVEQLEIH